MILSILIATLESRREQFAKLLVYLTTQRLRAGYSPLDIEIIWRCDNGAMSIGNKRQLMIEGAAGDYISFIDDDDHVDPLYIHKIMSALKQEPDCVGFNVRCNFGGEITKAVVSNKYDGWYANRDGYDHVRSPNHLAAIRREHCLAIGFKDMRSGEDHDFSVRMTAAGLLKKEVFIDEYLYEYIKL